MGYSPQQVGAMTLDMIFMLLADIDNLRSRGVRRRQKVVSGAEASRFVGTDGYVKGRDKDGKPIKGKITGKSRASQLIEAGRKKRAAALAAEQAAKRNAPPKKRRKR